jgi:hypothetical protein
MALNAMAQNAISRAMNGSKTLIEQLKPILDELDVVYNAQGGLKDTITQADLDAIPSYSGLTKQQLDDGMFVLTATLKNDIAAAYSQLTQLAARA